MKSTFFIILLFFAVGSHAQQNLIPNPSFEEYTECPVQNELGQGEFLKCKDWWYPHPSNVGTPDYFNRCNNSVPSPNTGLVGVPNNFWGYQEAFDGDGYVGFVPMEFEQSDRVYLGLEMVSTKLREALKPCTNYKFCTYVSRANRSPFGCDALRVMLTRDSLFFNSPFNAFSRQATLEFDTVVIDTLSWVKIEGTFLARGGEEFVTIGLSVEFDSVAWELVDTVLAATQPNIIYAYYYIDSVSLVKVEEIDDCSVLLPNIITPNNDRTNDVLNISHYGVKELFIYNRWGNLMVELNETNPIWDGTYRGENCSEGVYYYIGEHESQQLKGTIQLIR